MKSTHGWGNGTSNYSAEYKLNRGLVVERDGGRCQEFLDDNTPCTYPGTECDHIIPRSQGGSDSVDNLRMLCRWHHNKKTSVEKNFNRTYVSMWRKPEQHPGITP